MLLPRPPSAPAPQSSRKTMLGIGSDLKNSGIFVKAPINQYNRIHPQFPLQFRLERRFSPARIVLRKVSKTIRRRLERVSRPIRIVLETLPNQLRSRKIRVFWAWDFWDYDGIHLFPAPFGQFDHHFVTFDHQFTTFRLSAIQSASSRLSAYAVVRSANIYLPSAMELVVLLRLSVVRLYHSVWPGT